MSPVWWESDDGWVNPAHVAAVDIHPSGGGGYAIVATLATGSTRLLGTAAERDQAADHARELVRAHLEAVHP